MKGVHVFSRLMNLHPRDSGFFGVSLIVLGHSIPSQIGWENMSPAITIPLILLAGIGSILTHESIRQYGKF